MNNELDIDGSVLILNEATVAVASPLYTMTGGGVETFEAYGTTSEGRGSAIIQIQVSNDGSTWQTAGTINLDLETNRTSDRFTMDSAWSRWTYIRANLKSISGTGASVSVYKNNVISKGLAAELAALPLITTTAKTTSSTTEAGYTNARPVEHSYTGNFLPISTPAIAVDYHGIDAKFYASNGNVNSFASGIQTQVYAFEATAGFLTPTAATIGRLVPMYGQARNDSPGTVDEARLLQVWAQNVGTGQIKSVTGFIMYNPSNTGGGAPPQYVYGINMPDLTAGTVDNYAIKTGLGKVSFGDAVSMTSTGPVPAFNATSTHTGYWAAQFTGPDYGITIATSANTGRTLDVNKNGTGSGSVVVVTNKGTGSTMLLRNSTTTLVDFRANGSLSWTLPATDTPASNGMITMELVSNTSLVIKVKGSDGVVRSATLTLS